ncbi:MAG TPA: zinc-ribbon domain-containing protein [Dehalococcoidia bacterium]|nr:zinc-ribbon domain-containing protein [Dehalococcoidia bacterium]
MQQRCPNCGSPVVPGQRFCGACGAQISLSCPQCRITVSPGTRFCPNCGTALAGPQPQQPAWAPQQQQTWAPQQQQAWAPQQQPAWAPPAPKAPPSSARPFLITLLIVLLVGLGGLIYWQFGGTIRSFLATSGTPTPTVDTTKPIIKNITAVAGATSAAIRWETNEPSSSQVEYGTSDSYGSVAPAVPDHDPTGGESLGVVDHLVNLTGLEPETTYHYRVKSKDKAGNEAVSEDKTFTTTALEE